MTQFIKKEWDVKQASQKSVDMLSYSDNEAEIRELIHC